MKRGTSGKGSKRRIFPREGRTRKIQQNPSVRKKEIPPPKHPQQKKERKTFDHRPKRKRETPPTNAGEAREAEVGVFS